MIAIKDMKMPTECGYCGFYRYYPENGNVWCNAKNRILKMYWKDLDWTHLDVERPDWCPLIEIKTDGDTISRHMAIDAALKLTYADGAYGYADAKELVDSLETLPSAQPERKTGRWIPVDSYTAFGGDEATWLAHGNPIAYHYCSECKNHAYALEDGEDLLSDFCPNCGSPMLKEGESDDS